MIVPMKKISIVSLSTEQEVSLKKLAQLGVMHIVTGNPSSAQIEELNTKIEILGKALNLLPKTKKKIDYRKKVGLNQSLKVAEKVIQIGEDIDSLEEKKKKIHQQIDRISDWGKMDPQNIDLIKHHGINIKLIEIDKKNISQIPENVYSFIIKKKKNKLKIVCIYFDQEIEIPFTEFKYGDRSQTDLESEFKAIQNKIIKLNKRLQEFIPYIKTIEQGLKNLHKLIEFEQVKTSMKEVDQLVYLSGFAPNDNVAEIKKAAQKNGWALLIEQPARDDPVPTLVRYPKLIRIIKPVFDFLGTVPGYREYDISGWFLLFFSIFFGMLVGDAGYGVIFFLLTLITKLVIRKVSIYFVGLLLVTSLVTIIWGTITGNWFGVKEFASVEPLSWFVVPAIASFSQQNTTNFIMQICFLIGAIHLTISHIMNFLKLFPKLKAYADLGWISIIWGIYFLTLTVILAMDLNPLTIYLLVGGFIIIIIFVEQEGKFFKGLLRGIGQSLLNLLSGISAFSDVVSYVRLYAVGLATLKIAEAFNIMAKGIGFNFPLVIFSALVLFLGHSLNLILAVMAIIVHGVRLNMLEFSGHLGMEWSGKPYKPFKL